MTGERQYDVLIAGAGFAGSLMAIALKQSGFNVLLVEKGTHPRFAIGESSTPIADMILRELSTTYNMPWLYPFSRYGSWTTTYPHIACGLKRGFSYYKHYPGTSFSTDSLHRNELLVAASVNDTQSDTHWYRADFDAHLVERAKLTGVDYLEETAITALVRRDAWTATLAGKNASPLSVKASLFIDATGNANLLRGAMGVQTRTEGFETDSFAIFSHFEDLPRWQDHVVHAGVPVDDYPYDPDDSALHQVIDEGWLWMLRFNNRRTSVGLALANTQQYAHVPTEQIWRDVLSRYPSVWKLMGDATMSPVPGGLVRSARLQRRLTACCGEGWVALPHSVGFIDPLHSTGIALSLSGIEKLLPIIIDNWGNEQKLQESLRDYERSVFAEIALIDKLVAGCYRTFRYFELFSTWTMMYFISAVTYEQRRLSGQQTGSFLCADNVVLMAVINDSYADLVGLLNKNDLSHSMMRNFTQTVKERIHPFNIPGLLDERHRNMYKHSAAVF